jgi:regulator of replication initiation timing
MSSTPTPTTLEQLETLVPQLVEKIRRLEDERASLVEETDRLKTELEHARESMRHLQEQNETMSRVEKAQKDFEAERAQIRSRVAGLLEKLENTDFL